MPIKPHVTAAQVCGFLESRIKSGEWGAEAKLPSERAISDQLQTSRVTVREALKRLEANGQIYRSNRRGWFVAPPRIDYDPSRSAHFTQYALEQGYSPYTECLMQRLIQADDDLAGKMAVAEGTQLLELHRCRGINGRLVYLEEIFLRADLWPDLIEQPPDQSLSTMLRNHYGQLFKQVDVDISIASLSAAQAEILQAPAGCSCFYISRRTLNQEGLVIEYDREYWRHDALNIKVTHQFAE
ncbi:MAG: UTRA domain-containing protein [Chromatiales bacterium]|nr:UTRA domain-containing protein [Chromatiales bacterium]